MKNKVFGALFKNIREQLGLSVSKCSDYLYLSRPCIYDVEKGLREIDEETLSKIERLFGFKLNVDVNELNKLEKAITNIYRNISMKNLDEAKLLCLNVINDDIDYHHSLAFTQYNLLLLLYKFLVDDILEEEYKYVIEENIECLSDSSKVIYYLSMSSCGYRNRFDNKTLDDYLRKCIPYLENVDFYLVGMVHYYHAIVLCKEFKCLNALQYIKLAYRDFQISYNYRKMPYVSLVHAVCYMLLMLYDKAEKLFMELYDYASNDHDEELLQLTKLYLGYLYRFKEDYTKSLYYLQQVKKYEDLNKLDFVLMANNLSLGYYEEVKNICYRRLDSGYSEAKDKLFKLIYDAVCNDFKDCDKLFDVLDEYYDENFVDAEDVLEKFILLQMLIYISKTIMDKDKIIVYQDKMISLYKNLYS